MSEPFAEARITIIPDTKIFRARLLEEVAAATRAASEVAVVSVGITTAGGATAASALAETQAAAAKTSASLAQGQTAVATTGALATREEIALAAATLTLERAQTAQSVAATKLGAAREAVVRREAILERLQAKSSATAKELAAAEGLLAKANDRAAVAEERLAQATSATAIAQARRTRLIETQATQASASLSARGAAQLEAARAAEVDAGALQAEAAQARIAELQNRSLAASQALVARSEALSAGAAEAAASRVGSLSKARAVAGQTAKAQAVAEEGLAAALRSRNLQQEISAAAALSSAEALNADAQAAVRDAVAHAENAGAVSANARAHEQFGRAIRANAASMTGLRGAVLSSSNAFILGTVSAIAITKAIQGASDQVEQLNKAVVVFGSSSKEIQEFAETAANSFGIADTEALKFAGTFGGIFRALHFTEPAAAAMSITLVKLAADMASFNNASPEQTLKALQSGLAGQARPLRQFQVFLTAARVSQEALRVTGKKSVQDLTEHEKVQARFNIILRDSVLAQGDFARTADRTANQGRILRANIANLSDEIGKGLLPAVNRLIVDVNRLFIVFNKLNNLHVRIPDVPLPPGLERLLGIGEGGGGFSINLDLKGNFKRALGDLVPALGPLRQFEKGLGDIPGVAEPAVAEIDKVTASVNELLDAGRKKGGLEGIEEILSGLDLLIVKLKASGPVGELFAEQLQLLRNQIAKTGDIPANFNLRLALKWVNLQEEAQARLREMREFIENLAKLAGGVTVNVPLSLNTQIDVAEAQGQPTLPLLRQQLAKRQAFLNRLLAAPQGTFKQALIDQAARNVTETKNAIKAITDQQASTAREAADKITTAREKANQAFLDAFDPKEQRRENAISAARANGSIQEQINAERAFRQFLKREIDSIARRIRALHLQGAALEAARAAIRAAQQKRFELKQEIDGLLSDKADAREAAAQAARDARQQHLEAVLSIAETTPGTRDDRRALERLIRFDEAQIARLKAIRHKTQEEKAQLDAYRVDLAQRNQALRELKGEQDKGTDAAKAFAQAQFEFLRAQQGFAANLLGNLIPLGAAGGLVGGTAGGAIPPPFHSTVVAPPEKGAKISAGLQGQTAIAEGRKIGPTKVGQDTELHLLREIRRLLHEIHRGAGHPEAAYRRHHNRSALNDYGHSGSHNG